MVDRWLEFDEDDAAGNPNPMVYVVDRYTGAAVGEEIRLHRIGRWERPIAVVLRATSEERWERYRQMALAELDAEFPG